MSRHSPDQNPLPFPDTGSHAEPRADDHAANPAAGLHADPDAALAGSYDFMHLFGHTVLGLMWGRMAVAAQKALDEGRGDAEFYRTKLATGRYYMKRQLPMTATHLARIQSGSDTVMALAAEQF